jgi:RNase P/RNase MRP subunit p30
MIRFNSSFNTRIARLKELSLELEHIIIMYDKYFDYDYKVKNFKNKFTAGNKMTRIIIRLIEDNRDFRKKIRETYEKDYCNGEKISASEDVNFYKWWKE